MTILLLSVLLLTLLSFTVGWIVGVEGRGIKWLVFTLLVMAVLFTFNLVIVSFASAISCIMSQH